MRLQRVLAPAFVCVLLGVCATVILTALPASAQTAAAGWTWPVAGGSRGVVRGFSPPVQPWLPGHRGVDLGGHRHEIVRSAGAGRVHFAGRIGRLWIVSVLHPDGLLTTYEPVRPLVRRGTWVQRGQPIGRLLRSGSHCAVPCLHWGLRRGAAYLDPLALVGAARVRLLPLYPPDGPFPLPAPLSAGLAGGLGMGSARMLRRRRQA